jgi:hypothetical protein
MTTISEDLNTKSNFSNKSNYLKHSVIEEDSLIQKNKLREIKMKKSNNNPYDKPKIIEKDLLKEKYIPDMNLQNIRSRQTVIISSEIDGVNFTFLIYPSIHCFINIIDINLDNKKIDRLSSINYWSTLTGHKAPITELNYFDKEFQEPILVSTSMEGRMILWLQIPGKIVKTKFLNEVNIQVKLFEKFKVFNYDCLINSMILIEENKFKAYCNNFTFKNMHKSVFPLLLVANDDEIIISDLDGNVINSIRTCAEISDNYIFQYYQFKYEQDRMNILLSGSEIGNGIKAYSIEPFSSSSNTSNNYDLNFDLKEIFHLKHDGDITSISVNTELDTILFSTGIGKISVYKAKIQTDKVVVDSTNESNDLKLKNPHKPQIYNDQPESLSNSFKFDKFNSSNSNMNFTNNSKFNHPNLTKTQGLHNNKEEKIIITRKFTMDKLLDVTLDGCVFSCSYLKNNCIGYAIDLDIFDVKSDSGFGYIYLKDKTFSSQEKEVENYESQSIIHKSYIFNYELVHESVLNRIVLITIGLDKKIKVYSTEGYLL